MRRARWIALALAVVGAVVLAVAVIALAGRPPAPRPALAAPPGSPTAAPTAAPDPEPGPDPAAGLRAALLTPADAGPGYRAGADPSAAEPTAPPCGDEPVRDPDAVRAGAALTDPDSGAAVQQVVSRHPDAAAALAAFEVVAAGLDCAVGEVAGARTEISAAADLTADIGGERATGWQLGVGGQDVLVVAVLSGDVVVTFGFSAPEGSALAARPDALGLTRTGVERLGTT